MTKEEKIRDIDNQIFELEKLLVKIEESENIRQLEILKMEMDMKILFLKMKMQIYSII